MNELVKVDPKEFGLEDVQVATIEQAFLPKIAERDGYAQIYEQLITKELTKELCTEARELRLKLVKTRTGISDIHKTQKAFFLSAGKFVDAWKNKETLPVEQMEENLSKIEKHYENIEKERITKLELERSLEIIKYSVVVPTGLGSMNDQVYETYLKGCVVAYEARIQAEQEAEAERLRLIEVEKENARLKAIEDEKIRTENEKLKADAIAKEKEIEAERKQQADLLTKQKADADEKARVEKEKQDQILADIEAKAKIERDKSEAERKRLEDELKAKQEAEHKDKEEADKKEAERIAAEQKAKSAPDKEKLSKMVDSITIEIPVLADATSIAVANVVNAKFVAFKAWAKTQIESI